MTGDQGISPRPAADVAIDERLVRRLLQSQHPDLAGLPLRHLDAGWDNELYQLGESLLVRLPRRAMSAPLVDLEQRWLPELAPVLPLAIPVPRRVGAPSEAYPYRWSIVDYVDGTTPGPGALDSEELVDALGRFLIAMRRPAPSDAPRNPYRGIPMREREPIVREHLERVAGVLGDDRRGRIEDAWLHLSAGPEWEGAPMWCHGDLHPGNLVVRDGRLVSVLDFGDLTAGDPAVDVSIAWMAVPESMRPRFREASGVDADLWRRGGAWAVALSLAYLVASADDPTAGALIDFTFEAVLDDPSLS